MSDDHDFAIDPESPKPAGVAAETPPAAPLVVIEYRRGLSARLLPPLLILMAAAVILSYQRQTSIRPIVPAPAASPPKAATSPGRLIMVEGSGIGAAVGPIVARTEKRVGPPGPPVSSPPPMAPADSPPPL